MAMPFYKAIVIIMYHASVQNYTARPSREPAEAKSGDLQKRFESSRVRVDGDFRPVISHLQYLHLLKANEQLSG
jgi:hypothetical protein